MSTTSRTRRKAARTPLTLVPDVGPDDDTTYECAHRACGHHGDVLLDLAVVDEHGDVFCSSTCLEAHVLEELLHAHEATPEDGAPPLVVVAVTR